MLKMNGRKWSARDSAHESLLPGALLVTIRLQALAALVFVHLQTALLLEVAHDRKDVVVTKRVGQPAGRDRRCKARNSINTHAGLSPREDHSKSHVLRRQASKPRDCGFIYSQLRRVPRSR